MTKDDAAELLDLIIERAPDLRAAGVLTVNLGEAGFTLAAAEPGQGSADTTEGGDEERAVGVLHDPATHGVIGKDAPKVVTLKRRPI